MSWLFRCNGCKGFIPEEAPLHRRHDYTFCSRQCLQQCPAREVSPFSAKAYAGLEPLQKRPGSPPSLRRRGRVPSHLKKMEGMLVDSGPEEIEQKSRRTASVDACRAEVSRPRTRQAQPGMLQVTMWYLTTRRKQEQQSQSNKRSGAAEQQQERRTLGSKPRCMLLAMAVAAVLQRILLKNVPQVLRCCLTDPAGLLRHLVRFIVLSRQGRNTIKDSVGIKQGEAGRASPVKDCVTSTACPSSDSETEELSGASSVSSSARSRHWQ